MTSQTSQPDTGGHPARFSGFIIGTTALVMQCGDLLLRKGWNLLGVVSPEAAVRDWAQKKSIPAWNVAEGLDRLRAAVPFDHLFSVVNYRVLPADILTLPTRGAINYHDGPLPRYAGTRVTAWALMNGETEHGITWHEMTAEVDAGRILKQVLLPVNPDDTSGSLNFRCYVSAVRSFAELLDEMLAGRVVPVVQDLSQRTYYPYDQKPPRLGFIDWSQQDDQIHNLIRALDFGRQRNPFGFAKTTLHGAILAVTQSRRTTSRSAMAPGTIMESVAPDGGKASEPWLRVATGGNDLLVSRLAQPDGSALPENLLGALHARTASLRFGAPPPAVEGTPTASLQPE